MPFYTERKGAPSPARPSSANPSFAKYSDVDLIRELRERQHQQRRETDDVKEQRRRERPKSAPRERPAGPVDPMWDVPTSRFGGFNQGAHAKSTVATKLNRAKKMADVYRERKSTRNLSG